MKYYVHFREISINFFSELNSWIDENNISYRCSSVFPLVYAFEREEDAFAVVLKFGLDHAKTIEKNS